MPFTVHVENFQSLLDVTLEVKGFTVITGTNNSGKSALMRAIRGAFQNTKGTAFVRHGTTKSVVELSFSDGAKLYWEKGTGKGDKPAYKVNGGNPLYPGQAVPDEVRALGVRPIMAGGREIWPQFAPQFTGSVFLLDQPGSVLAEAVSDVNRVTQLNDALRFAESDRRSVSSELKVRLTDKSNLEAEVKSYEGLDDQVSEVDAIEADLVKAHKVEAALQVLSVMLERLNKAQQAVAQLEGVDRIDIPDDNVLAQLQKGLADTNALQILETRLQAAQKAVSYLDGVDKIDVPDGDTLKVAQDTFAEEGVLTMLFGRLVEAQRAVKSLSGVSSVGVVGDDTFESAQQSLTEVSDLCDLQSKFQSATTRVQKLEGLPSIDDLDVTSAEKVLSNLNTALDLATRISTASELTASLVDMLAKTETALGDLVPEINSLLEGLGACPTCGNTQEHKTHG